MSSNITPPPINSYKSYTSTSFTPDQSSLDSELSIPILLHSSSSNSSSSTSTIKTNSNPTITIAERRGSNISNSSSSMNSNTFTNNTSIHSNSIESGGSDDEKMDVDSVLGGLNSKVTGTSVGKEDECGRCGNKDLIEENTEMKDGGGEGINKSKSNYTTSLISTTTGSSTAMSNSGSHQTSFSNNSTGSTGFDRFSLPTVEQLEAASKCLVVGESGQSIPFSNLIHQRGKVVVVFLRHLWCGLCQQYVTALQSLSSSLPSTTTSSGTTTYFSTTKSTLPPLYILLISSGSPSLISIYRSRLNCPFPLYVDQSRTLYKALGMTRKTLDPGRSSSPNSPNNSPPQSPSLESANSPNPNNGDRGIGSYTNGGMYKNVKESISSAVVMTYKSRSLTNSKPGNQRQLGGEFVFDSVPVEGGEEGERKIECSFVSRMSNTRNHSEITELFAAAGVNLDPLPGN